MIAFVFFLVALSLASLFARVVLELATNPRFASWRSVKQIGMRRVAVVLLAIACGVVGVTELRAFAGNGTMIPTAGRGYSYAPPTRPACTAGIRGFVWDDFGTPDRLLACVALTTNGTPGWRKVFFATNGSPVVN